MKIGIVAGAHKPLHLGHFRLIELASRENDVVRVLTSTADRSRPGELSISANDMSRVWELTKEILPSNVTVEFVKNPVRAVFEKVGRAEESKTFDDSYSIYSDVTDAAERYSLAQLKKYFPDMCERGLVSVRAVERTETADVSGTRVRRAIRDFDYEEFEKMVPREIASQVWDILSKKNHETSPLTKKIESTMREFIEMIVEDSSL